MKPQDNRSWLTALVQRRPSLTRFFKHKVGQEDAEDLVQEVYFRLLRLSPDLRELITSPEAYLFTIARNLLVERARLYHRQGISCDIDEFDQELVEPGPTVEEKLDQALRNARLEAVIEGLKPRFRAVIIMRYRHDMSYKEMAEQLQVSTHAIKKYLGEALQMCRLAMKRQGHG